MVALCITGRDCKILLVKIRLLFLFLICLLLTILNVEAITAIGLCV